MQDAPSNETDPGSRGITPEQRNDALRHVNSRRAYGLGFLWEWTKIFWISVALFLVLRTFIVEAFKIPSGSMEHTLLVGDFLLVNKLAYGAEVPFTGTRLPALKAPARGDVIVFVYPVDPSKNYVKRLIGLPGDTVRMRRGTVILNGVAQAEQYVEHTLPWEDRGADDFEWQRHFLALDRVAALRYHPTRDNWGPILVPPHHLFVLGDNRDNSSDSRYWGFVSDSLLRGQPLLVYFSYAPDTSQRFAWLTRIRWGRLGERIE